MWPCAPKDPRAAAVVFALSIVHRRGDSVQARKTKRQKKWAAAGNFFPLPQPSAVLLASEKIRYSVRMAARGESRMAFMDGYKPETMATTTEKATAPALSHTGMTERMPISVSRPLRPAPRA